MQNTLINPHYYQANWHIVIDQRTNLESTHQKENSKEAQQTNVQVVKTVEVSKLIVHHNNSIAIHNRLSFFPFLRTVKMTSLTIPPNISC